MPSDAGESRIACKAIDMLVQRGVIESSSGQIDENIVAATVHVCFARVRARASSCFTSIIAVRVIYMSLSGLLSLLLLG